MLHPKRCIRPSSYLVRRSITCTKKIAGKAASNSIGAYVNVPYRRCTRYKKRFRPTLLKCHVAAFLHHHDSSRPNRFVGKLHADIQSPFSLRSVNMVYASFSGDYTAYTSTSATSQCGQEHIGTIGSQPLLILDQHARAAALRLNLRILLCHEEKSVLHSSGMSALFISKESQDYIEVPIPKAPYVGLLVKHVITGEVLYTATAYEARATIARMMQDLRTFIAYSECCAPLHRTEYESMCYVVHNIEALIMHGKIVLLCSVVRYTTTLPESPTEEVSYNALVSKTPIPSQTTVKMLSSAVQNTNIASPSIGNNQDEKISTKSYIITSSTPDLYYRSSASINGAPLSNVCDQNTESELHPAPQSLHFCSRSTSCETEDKDECDAQRSLCQVYCCNLPLYDEDRYGDEPPPNMSIVCDMHATLR
jgi:hypothetical protein